MAGERLGKKIIDGGCVTGIAAIAIALGLVVASSTTASAQTQATPAHVLVWDQQETTSDLSFETQIDGQPPAPALGTSCNGTVCRSTLIQSLTTGPHTVQIRAYRIVNAVRRTGGWSAAFTFTMVADPTVPNNLRLEVPPGAAGIAVNGVIDRPPFKERGLDVVSIAPEGGGQVLVGAQGLRPFATDFNIRVGDRAGVVVWRP